jgi:hypothetical protein
MTGLDFLKERSVQTARKEIQNILDSYHHYWDVLAELVQNSRDAVVRRHGAASGLRGFLRVTVDYQTRTIEILDNGIGIGRERLVELLAPGGGDKENKDQEIGEKGVGLTFCVFSGSAFEILTRSADGVLHGGKVAGGHDWVTSSDSDMPRYVPLSESELPTTGESMRVGEMDYDTKQFTQITIRGVRNSDQETDLFNRTVNQVKFLLQTRTAVGDTKGLWDENASPAFDTYVRLRLRETEDAFATGKVPSQFPRLHTFVDKSRDLDEVKAAFLKKADTESRRKVMKDCTLYWVSEKPYKEDKIRVYGIMFPGNRIFGQLGKDVFKIVDGADDGTEEYTDELFKSGIFIATKGMPTGVEIEPGKGGQYPAYYRRCLFVVQYDKLKFDVGRKTVNHYLKRKLQEAVTDLFKVFEDIAPYQSDDERVDPSTEKPWGDTPAERAAEKEREWKRYTDLVSLGLDRIPYDKVPNKQEAAVAAIFHELLGARFLKGYIPLATGYSTRYDLHTLYRREGKGELKVVIEFKHALEDIVKDFDASIKKFSDMHLVVAWNANRQKLKDAGFRLDQVKGDPPFDGVTHLLEVPTPGIDPLPVILLETLVAGLAEE